MPCDMLTCLTSSYLKKKGVQTTMVRSQKQAQIQTFMHFLHGTIYLNRFGLHMHSDVTSYLTASLVK